MIPARIVDRLENPHLQRSVAGLRFHKRIVASEARRFHRFRLFESLQKTFSLDDCFDTNRFADTTGDIFGLLFG